MRLKDDGRRKQNAVWRNNTQEISNNSHANFGIIREGEATSQSGCSIVDRMLLLPLAPTTA